MNVSIIIPNNTDSYSIYGIITYHHGYTKKNNGIYHAIKSHECPGQRGFDFHECPRGFVGKKGCYFFHPHH